MKRRHFFLKMPMILLMLLALALLPAGAGADTDACGSSPDGQHHWESYNYADCTSGGSSYRQCSYCYEIRDEVWVDALGHNYQMTASQPATCTAPGSTTYTCTRCGDVYTATDEATGHVWDNGQVTTAATCTQDGVRTFTCIRCGETRTESIAKTNHSPVSIPAAAATCTAGGKTEGSKCSVCGTILTAPQDTGALGHAWDNGQVTTAATCTQDGVRTFTCTRCGETRTESIAKTGHSPVSIPAVAATCNAGGKTEGSKCSVCGTILTAQQDTPALGHSWNGGTVTREAGYLEPGVKTYTCTRCGETKTEEIQVNMPMSGGSIMDYFRNIPPEAASSDPLRIVTEPVGGSIDYEGGSMTLSVEAAGGVPPYTYQWRKANNGIWFSFWSNVEGGTDSTLEVTRGNFKYYCRVYDSKGDYVDSEIVLVSWNLYIAEQPQNVNLYGKDSVTLSCTAAGGEPHENGTYIYVWYNSADEQISFSDHGTVEVSEPGEYYCMVQDNGAGLITSKPVTVYETDPFEAKTDTNAVSLKEGEEYELRAQVSGGIAPYTGVWLRDGVEIPTQQTAEGEYTAPILGDGSKEVIYTFLATDAMDDAASCTVKVRYPQLGIIRHPQSGRLDEGKYTLGIVMADGEEPFTFTLYRNGELAGSYSNQRNFFYHDVTESGQYYYHAEDATGRWADSITVTVQDPVFRIDLRDTAYITSTDGSTLHAVPKNGVAPYRYSWWFIDPTDGHAEPMSYGDTATDTFIARYAGTYLCYAEDATKAFDRKEVVVYSTMQRPIITDQPRSVILDYDDSRDQYVHSFICEAIAYDGTKDTLEYRWERKTPSGWQDVRSMGHNAYTWIGYKSKGTADGGIFRCVVTDTRNGEKTVSNEAVVATKLMVEVVSEKIILKYISGQVVFSVYGGIAPYRVRGYAHRLNGIYDIDTIYDYLVRNIKSDELYFIDTLEWDDMYDQAPKERFSHVYYYTNDIITYSKSEPTVLTHSSIGSECYLVVTDASGQRYETPVYFEIN